VEAFGRPAFVWGQDDRGMLKGSFRGDGTVSYLDLVASFSEDIFSEFGGHKEAGGFTVEKEKIHFLEEVANNAYATVVDSPDTGGALKQDVSFDMEMGVSEVHDRTYRTLRKLSPFGIGNEKPLFVFRGVELAHVREFGKEKNHLEVLVADESGAVVKGIRFFATRDTFAGGLQEGDKVDVYATIEKSFFMGKVEVRLRIEDIHKDIDK
jgi:single-stranded-DNA-specific exonuclease